jgi:hypothetical protein
MFSYTKMAPSLVLFYSNSCFHCQNMKAAWNEFKSAMSKTASKLAIREYEASSFSSLTNDTVFGPVVKNMMGVPTIAFFGAKNNSPVYFNGARTAAGFQEFVKEQLKGSSEKKREPFVAAKKPKSKAASAKKTVSSGKKTTAAKKTTEKRQDGGRAHMGGFIRDGVFMSAFKN